MSQSSRLGLTPTDGFALRENVPQQSAPPQQTAREFLAKYYGAEWPQIEAEIEAAGGGLDVPYTFTPWELVEAEFEAQMQPSADLREQEVTSCLDWADPLTVEFLAERFGLPSPCEFDSSDVFAIDALTAELNQGIRERAEYVGDLVMGEARKKVARGRLRQGAIHDPGPEHGPRLLRQVYRRTRVGGLAHPDARGIPRVLAALRRDLRAAGASRGARRRVSAREVRPLTLGSEAVKKSIASREPAVSDEARRGDDAYPGRY